MLDRQDLIRLCQELCSKHETLVFWKHLEEALNGIGDFDTLAASADVLMVSGTLTDLLPSRIPGARAAVICDHLSHARLHAFVVEGMFPQLLEFDIGTTAKRFGAPWLEHAQVAAFSEVDERGIRKLRAGALAAVLVLLYGISRDGRNRMKSADYQTAQLGARDDSEHALRFCQEALPSLIRQPTADLMQAIARGSWETSSAREIWYALLRRSIRFALSERLPSMLRAAMEKWKPLHTKLRHIPPAQSDRCGHSA